MVNEPSANVVARLADIFDRARLHRSMRRQCYGVGDELVYEAKGVIPANLVKVRLVVEKFVGGGFAGQVYKVRALEVDSPDGPIDGLVAGDRYAVKILIPPTAGKQAFRDLLYKLGFQGPFPLQSNPDAARAGALWQKFIRLAASMRFCDQRAVVDVLATFVDSDMGSCGEISEWVEGRTWRFEVDDRLLARWRWKPGLEEDGLNSAEFRAKRVFMSDFVDLLHELGAPEFARQYEWWTCKSQPNVLKRIDSTDEPSEGLTAVDFRAGLALLAILPMSPGDLKLIVKGIARGSLVQFDRGDLAKLWWFLTQLPEGEQDGVQEAFEELQQVEDRYRNSQIDITHNHVRLLYDRSLWSGILDSTVAGWHVRGMTDDATNARLAGSRFLMLTFASLCAASLLGVGAAVATFITSLAGGWGFWPALAVSAGVFVLVSKGGRILRKLAGRADYRRHARGLLMNFGYFRRAFRGHVAEALIGWHRAGRVGDRSALHIAAAPGLFLLHAPLSLLPAKMHRALTDWKYALGVLAHIFVRPVRLYFDASAREQWLRDMVDQGRRHHMLSDEDAETIISQVAQPFIQKYLKSLAVHVCTLPVTQVVSVAVAIWYNLAHPELTAEQAGTAVAVILVAFQVTPISPGSLVRGLYVLYLVLKERNFKDYNIAVFLGFFKYVGYLAFPIQMTYRYPALARFMAAHWATGAVHVIPVFGEHGALLEHGVFDLFYNYPLTIRRQMRKRAQWRKALAPRQWHGVLIAATAVAVLVGIDALCRAHWGALPTLRNIWPATVLVPVALGCAVTVGAGGKVLAKRIRLTLLCGLSVGVGYWLMHAAMSFMPVLGGSASNGQTIREVVKHGMWCAFIFMLLSVVSALITEINLPEITDPSPSVDVEKPES